MQWLIEDGIPHQNCGASHAAARGPPSLTAPPHIMPLQSTANTSLLACRGKILRANEDATQPAYANLLKGFQHKKHLLSMNALID